MMDTWYILSVISLNMLCSPTHMTVQLQSLQSQVGGKVVKFAKAEGGSTEEKKDLGMRLQEKPAEGTCLSN